MEKKTYNTGRVFAAACAGIAFFGVAMLSIAPILGQISGSIMGANYLPAFFSTGIILGTIIVGPMIDHLGFKWIMIAGAIMILLGLRGLSTFLDIRLLDFSITMLGAGAGIINGTTNTVVADIYPSEKKTGRLGILGAMYGVGAMAWTGANVKFTDYHTPLDIFSLLVIATIIYFCFLRFPGAKPKEDITAKKSTALLKTPALLLFSLVLFFESGFEGPIGNFSIEFFTRTDAMSHRTATIAMTFFSSGMILGRLPLGYLTKKLNKHFILFSYLALAVIGMSLYWIGQMPITLYFAMTFIGIGIGATYPMILNYISDLFRTISGTAISIAMTIAIIGQLAFNTVVGKAFAEENFVVLPILLTDALVLMMSFIPIALIIAHRARKKK